MRGGYGRVWASTRAFGPARLLCAGLLAAALVQACATTGPSLSGTSAGVAWEIVDIVIVQETSRVRWSFTVVLRETGGRRITFDSAEISWTAGPWAQGGSKTEPLFERLPPRGELRLQRTAFSNSGEIVVFMFFSGQDDAGKRATVQVRADLHRTVRGGRAPTAADTLQAEVGGAIAAGRYRDAIGKARGLVELQEREHGPDHPVLAASLDRLGVVLRDSGEYAAARPVFERSLRIRERALGADHPLVAVSLNHLGYLSRLTGEYPAGRALYERALRISEAALHPGHPVLGLRHSNLGELLRLSGDYVGAKRHLERALAIRERALGPEHRDVGDSLQILGSVARSMGDSAGAATHYERALRIREKALGPHHERVATSVLSLAQLRAAGGESEEPERLYRRAIAIYEAALGPEHPWVGGAVSSLADLLARERRVGAARSQYERARRILLAVGRTNLDLDDDAYRTLFRQGRSSLRRYARLLADVARDPGETSDGPAAVPHAFLVAEQGRAGGAQAALMRAAARAASDDPETAGLAREVQDLRDRRQALRRQLRESPDEAGPGDDPARRRSILDALGQIEREMSAANERLGRAFPRYAQIIAPEPIEVTDVERLLAVGEALISYAPLPDRLLVWVVRPDRPLAYREVDRREAELARLVARVRASLDQTRNESLGMGLLLPFDVEGAHELYRALLAPVVGALDGVSQLLVVPDDVLLPLPFGVLVTEAGGAAYEMAARLHAERRSPTPEELSRYAELSWLTRKYALTILPSATSLRGLRQVTRVARGDTEPFLGFGDPLLDGTGRHRGGQVVARRGARVDVKALRGMNRLPGSRDELLTVARTLGANPSTTVYVSERATKAMVRDLDRGGRLGRARVVAFATHGLMGGELEGLREPALVLTPPAEPSDEDDGLLTLEDVLRLKLPNTEWVVLSACNTGAADGSGEGLAGLARAFFFAGARSLLVSHWSVDDRATRALMSEVFRQHARDRAASRAEVLRRGMLELLAGAHGPTAYFAHPFAWAPFFLVGEGGRNPG